MPSLQGTSIEVRPDGEDWYWRVVRDDDCTLIDGSEKSEAEAEASAKRCQYEYVYEHTAKQHAVDLLLAVELAIEWLCVSGRGPCASAQLCESLERVRALAKGQ